MQVLGLRQKMQLVFVKNFLAKCAERELLNTNKHKANFGFYFRLKRVDSDTGGYPWFPSSSLGEKAA